MELVKLNKDMINILTSIIGNKFLNYECDLEEKFNRTYVYLRINTSNKSIDISNEQEPINLFGEIEDVSNFKCFDNNGKSLKDSFNLINDYSSKKIEVNEIIKNIFIVSEIIDIDSKQVEFDMGIIIETDKHKYLFSRKNWFDEFIYIDVDKTFDEIYPLLKDKEDWSSNNINIIRKLNKI